jgi:predicted RNA-binding protein associated with RNAse of E/G family
MQRENEAQEIDDPDQLEQIFSQEIDQLTDNFIRLNLYDKINELIEKIDIFLDVYNRADDALRDRLNQVKNYLNILGSLIFNLDVNLLYQLYITLEMKAIDILRDEADIGPDPEFENIFNALEDQVKINEKRAELPPKEIINKLQTGEMTKEDLEQFIQEKIYSPGEIKKIIQAAEINYSDLDDDKIEKIADLIKSGEISINDLEGAVDKGEMTLGDLERIKAEIQSDNQLSQDIEQEFSDVDQGRKLSDEQIQQIAQGLQSGQIKEEEIQQALQSGQLTQADVEAIQQAMQSEENSDQSQDQNQGLSDEQIQQIAQGLINGDISEDEIMSAVNSGQITEEDLQKIENTIQQIQSQNQQNPEQNQQSQSLENQDRSSELLELAKKILNKEITADDLLNALNNNEISKEDFKKIMDIIADLKSN